MQKRKRLSALTVNDKIANSILKLKPTRKIRISFQIHALDGRKSGPVLDDDEA